MIRLINHFEHVDFIVLDANWLMYSFEPNIKGSKKVPSSKTRAAPCVKADFVFIGEGGYPNPKHYYTVDVLL